VTTPAPPSKANIDIGRALSFAFEDPEWMKKLAIGGLVMFAGVFVVGMPLLFGYYQRIIQRTVAGESRPLPEWSDWGALFVDGLKLWAVMMVHVWAFVLPVGAIVGVGGVVAASLEHLPRGAQTAAAVVLILGALALYAMFLAATMLMAIYLPVAQVRLATTGSMREAFRFSVNLAFIRRNAVNYALAFAVALISSMAAQFGLLLCCVGFFPATVWSYWCFCWALGETARLDAATSASAPELGAS
jgi:hypothetical protein